MPSASRIANANLVAPVHHGIPVHLLKPNYRGEYVAFLGRISPEKRPDRAIRIIRPWPTKIYEQQSCRCQNGHPFASASCANRPSGQPH